MATGWLARRARNCEVVSEADVAEGVTRPSATAAALALEAAVPLLVAEVVAVEVGSELAEAGVDARGASGARRRKWALVTKPRALTKGGADSVPARWQ